MRPHADSGAFPGGSAPAGEPDVELRKAVGELLRVLVPGGTLLATVPYGRREDHGWFRQFDRADVDTLLPGRVIADIYRYSAEGWQKSSLDAAARERYHDHHADRRVPPDRAAAARAVACLQLRLHDGRDSAA